MKFSKLFAVAALAAPALADIPAHCLRDTTLGSWTFYVGPDGQSSSVDCSGFTKDQAATKLTFDLSDPNVATASDGTVGEWTLVYDQGFEVTVADQTYWAFFDYSVDASGDVTSFCGQTSPGWAHEVGVLPKNWACYVAEHEDSVPPATHTPVQRPSGGAVQDDPAFVERLRETVSWEVRDRSFLHGMAHEDASRYAGAVKHHDDGPRAAPVSRETTKKGGDAPDSWDWIADGGLEFPMRDQLNCGSCYAFASTTAWTAQARLKNDTSTIYSPQELVSCSPYAQGCDGGFPYLMTKYANDFGVLEDKDFPYSSGIRDDVACDWAVAGAERLVVTDPEYVGGYYGACNAELMKQALYEQGPLAVSFEVESDFSYYSGGVYVPSAMKAEINPWVETNHVVVIVGYGTDEDSGLPYWNVQNSWGYHFGESGFFRIVRGNDACGIETMAVTFDVQA